MKNQALKPVFKKEQAFSGRISRCWLAGILFVALVGVHVPARAQDAESVEAMKEAIKREILQELRSEGTQPDAEMRQLREALKKEIIEELRKELSSSSDAPQVLKEELKNDLREEFRRELDLRSVEAHPQAVQLVAASAGAGHAEGQMLRRGRGLVGCKVKLVQLSGRSTRFQGYSEGEEFLTTTDAQGKYRFEGIPIGNYKIKWELPGDQGWIKRLRNAADVTVESGRVSVLKPIETARTLAPR
ncbi:MAG: carboxypeptidase-like regulatory domain-containing protein [Candidatus Hydrogenedentes bacterium]|nr:carboxypeptidase-like regulatory domain-containing protein [Candidatus Hydrogenedentota bacterium]